MYTAQNGIFNKPGSKFDEEYYFAGWSYGFETKFQKLDIISDPYLKDEFNLDYDSYVYRYSFTDDYRLSESKTESCLYEEEFSGSIAQRTITKTDPSYIDLTQAPSFQIALTRIFTRYN